MGNIFNTSFLRMLIVKSNCFTQPRCSPRWTVEQSGWPGSPPREIGLTCERESLLHNSDAAEGVLIWPFQRNNRECHLSTYWSQAAAYWPGSRVFGYVTFALVRSQLSETLWSTQCPSKHKQIWVVCQPMQEWWRMDNEAPWRSPENRPGPSPFKDCERPFSFLPAGDDPRNIKPDIVHTFHIGFGVDLAASIVVWLCKLGIFNNGQPRQSLDDKLRCAYSSFREFCHETHRFTACDQWCLKKMGMGSTFGKI